MSMLLKLRQLINVPQSTRSLVNKAVSRPVPRPRGEHSGSIVTPEAFLKAIGRSSETKITAGTWEDLWKLDGRSMKEAGIAVKDRRYILWCMEKFRLGLSPEDFAHPPKPKKKIRGWGPAVQHGKRIRSRRHS